MYTPVGRNPRGLLRILPTTCNQSKCFLLKSFIHRQCNTLNIEEQIKYISFRSCSNSIFSIDLLIKLDNKQFEIIISDKNLNHLLIKAQLLWSPSGSFFWLVYRKEKPIYQLPPSFHCTKDKAHPWVTVANQDTVGGRRKKETSPKKRHSHLHNFQKSPDQLSTEIRLLNLFSHMILKKGTQAVF